MRRALVVTLGAIGLAACEPVAPATGRVDIVAAGLVGEEGSDAADRLTLDLELANGTDETVFVYGSVRRVLHDATTNRTTLQLRSNPCEDNPVVDMHWLLPPSRILGPRAYGRVEIPTARAYRELVAHDPITFRDVPVAAASALEVELAWTDRAFAQHGPGCLEDALLALERGVAKKTITP